MSPPIINFPSLQPAIVWKVNVGAGHPIGPRQSGATLIHFETPTGTVETVEGFEPKFKANVVFGADWLEFDPDQKHARINMKAIARTEDGKEISFGYTGIIDTNEAVLKIFHQQPDSVSVPFGFSTGAHTFHSGDPELQELQNFTLIGNGRMLVDEKTRVITVESRLSKVVPATGFD
ncbi:hypothetical protein N8T08_007198 [Aspergillus melleus]|uniref:Uncharacterized protein n=1 Tax=Aspergillus melleus TaxID=138277 RepID=A0ACC3AZ83_9EURO|nr:uncharacterized protein LDX57_006901 [Aspergillus melleus]KAH8429234.1 hypothetical protein LDX57_006901 [Aspergillus melleus]KAK1142957.1 hypothetical protein N8T08_007198 [Aspergillus melleus]